MNRAEIVTVLAEILDDIAEIEPEELEDDAAFDELGLDSLDLVEAACRIEDALAIELDGDLDRIETVGQFLDMLEGKE